MEIVLSLTVSTYAERRPNGTGADSGGPAAARATCAAGDQKADHQRAGASLGGGGTAGGGGEPGDSGVPGNRGSNDEARDEKTER